MKARPSAISALRTAVKQDKADGDAWYYLGLALVRVDDMKAAQSVDRSG
jgi:cytochrome c-type biogenesis protein CcmH/NrfG